MFISQVVSYGGAWERLNSDCTKQLSDIHKAVSGLTVDSIRETKLSRPFPSSASALASAYRVDACWQKLIEERQWFQPPRRGLEQGPGRHVSMRMLGHLDQRVSIAYVKHRDILNRWLYTVAPIAVRSGHVDIPVALVLLRDAQELLLERTSTMSHRLFEDLRDELLALSPLSHGNPFAIVGASFQSADPHVIELSTEHGVEFRQIVVNRSIEFPPEYHQAGLGVLSFFGSVLREKYPNHDAKVRIEQDGLKVRLIIESANGDREIIEKALQEYELVVRGEAAPESLLTSPSKILELKSELRIAQVRIESQRDIIRLQGDQISTLSQLIGHTLSRPTPPMSVHVQPVIQIESSISQSAGFAIPFSDISDDLEELCLALSDETLKTKLLDLQEAIEASGSQSKPETVRTSSGLRKLRELVEEASTVGTKTNEMLSKLESGISLIQSLGRKYNSIAEWCGAPQIPRPLLGGDS